MPHISGADCSNTLFTYSAPPFTGRRLHWHISPGPRFFKAKVLAQLRGRDGKEPTSGYYQGMADRRESIREQIAQLERQRSRLEEVRLRAQAQGGPEGERLEAQASARLREIEQRIADLRFSLE